MASLRLLKQVRPPESRRLRLQRMTRSSSSFLTARLRMSDIYVKRVLKLNQRLNEHERNAFWTSPSVARCLSPSRTTGLYQGVGRPAKAAPSTCKTSSEAASYAKRLWLPKGANSWSVTCPRLNREYWRGFLTTKTCSTSSNEVVTLMQRSVRRCLTFPAFLKSLTQTYDSLRKAHYLAAVTASVGLRLRPSFLLGFSGPRRNATTKRLQRS